MTTPLVKVTRPTASGPWVISPPNSPAYCVANRYEAVIAAAREERAIIEAKTAKAENEGDKVRYCDYRSCTNKSDWRMKKPQGVPGNTYTNSYCERCRAHLVLPTEDLIRLTPEPPKIEREGQARLKPADLVIWP